MKGNKDGFSIYELLENSPFDLTKYQPRKRPPRERPPVVDEEGNPVIPSYCPKGKKGR